MIASCRDTVAPNPIQRGTVRLKPEVAADAAFLCALHDSVKGTELASLPVGDPVRRQLLDMQYRAMTESYHAAFPNGCFDLIILNEVRIGRLISDLNKGLLRIVYIALLPEWRGHGICTALMRSVLETPERSVTRCEATVALDNPASLRLWARLGFVERERSETDLVLEWRSSHSTSEPQSRR
jgi:RimJ/RimL family protein N-acetyltransferase